MKCVVLCQISSDTELFYYINVEGMCDPNATYRPVLVYTYYIDVTAVNFRWGSEMLTSRYE